MLENHNQMELYQTGPYILDWMEYMLQISFQYIGHAWQVIILLLQECPESNIDLPHKVQDVGN